MRHLRIAWHQSYIQPLPEGHRFPMEKYDLLPKQLLHEGTVDQNNFFEPEEMDRSSVIGIHDEEYVDRLFNLQLTRAEQRKSGFVHNDLLINREKRIVEGTRMCAEEALKHGVGMNIAGGTHHAYADRAEGFCMLNDQALAVDYLMKEQGISKVLIIDLDVHQGNGTAKIFEGNNSVFTFSMHGRNNYPLKKEVSDLDVELEDGIRNAEYHYLLEKNLDNILADFRPEFVFYQSGVDVLETDKLGRLGLTKEGCKGRDRIVFDRINELRVPIVCSMGGGYSKDIRDIIEAHANTFRLAQEIFY